MKRTLFVILFLFQISLFAQDPLAEQKQHFHKELDKLFEEYHQYILEQFPESASYNGDHRYDDKLTDYSAGARVERKQKIQNFQTQIRAFNDDFLFPADKLNKDLFLESIEQGHEAEKFNYWMMPLNQQGGIHISFPLIIQSQQLDSLSHLDRYFTRLKGFGRQVEDVIQSMKEGMNVKVVLPKVVAEKVVEQLERLNRELLLQPFYTVAKERIEKLSKEQTLPAPSIGKRGELKPLNPYPKQLDDAMAEVTAAYKRLMTFFKAEYLPKCRTDVGEWSLPNGIERYNFAIKSHTSLPLTADEVFKTGEKEVARIAEEMDELKNKIGFKGSREEFHQHLRTSKEFYFTNKQDLLNSFTEILDRANSRYRELFGFIPQAQCEVKELEEYRSAAAPQAYYYSAPEDRSRPGYFYVNTTSLPARPTYTMTALTLHEAVPGHHLQIAVSQEQKNLPWFRREMSVTAFVEGWALYAERLGHEMGGMYNDDYQKYGGLGFEMWRACRLVVDAGIHAKKWTREQAIDYMKRYTVNSEADIISEVDRYIAWAGQACAYKIGEIKIREIRSKVEKQLGDKFNIRDFHDKLLENGAIALPLLEKIMDDWVKEVKAKS